MAFYHSKWKLFLGVIFSLLFATLGVLMVGLTYTERSVSLSILAMFITVLFGIFTVANILKMIRGYPYITITDEYLQLDSFTRSEITIYFTDIRFIKISEVSFQRIIEIVLYDEDDYFYQLSFHNKVRLFMNRVTGFTLFSISVKAVRKRERPALFEALDDMQQRLNGETPLLKTTHKRNEEVDFMEKYNPVPPSKLSINRSYFLKSYGYGFLMFAFSFILFYWLISKNDNYLFYIVVSFILYPFAKVLVDWLFRFKLKHRLDNQKGITYYFDQLLFMFDLFLFHVSLFVAPFGLLFLLIRFIVIRLKR